MRTLSFSVNEITVTPGSNSYFDIEIETDFVNEVINEFPIEVIIDEYEDLDLLYEKLKEHLNK